MAIISKSSVPLQYVSNGNYYGRLRVNSKLIRVVLIVLGHHVIYLEHETQWYFYDPADHMYKSTSSEKLLNLIRGMLMKCAEELTGEADIFNLFLDFRSDRNRRTIIQRAKSILAADHTFFEPHQNINDSKARSCMRGWCACWWSRCWRKGKALV